MRIFAAIGLSICLLGQVASAASPLSTPVMDGTSNPSRSKITEKSEKREPAQSNPDKLSAAINELTIAIRDFKTKISNTDEKEKIQSEGESLKAEKKIADETENLAKYTDRLASFTAVLVIVGALQLGLFFWQLILMNTAAKDAGKSADAALKTAKSIETAERAYVKLSHVAPGLGFDELGGVWVQLRVRNFGKTPARVNEVRVEFRYLPDILAIPVDPPAIEKREDVLAFLVPDDEFFFTHQRALGNTVLDNVRKGVGTLLVWGYIDYTDAFDQRHCAGYGRVYGAGRDIQGTTQSDESFNQRSNLDLVTQQAYNYDRPYKDGQNS